jgi:hypothetical protein
MCVCVCLYSCISYPTRKRMQRINSSYVACLTLPYLTHYPIICTIFIKAIIVLHITWVLIFSTIFFLNISHFKNNSATCYHKCTYFFLLRARYSCQILMKFYFPYLFSKNKHLISWKLIRCEPNCSVRKDRRDETNSRFSQCCERTYKLNEVPGNNRYMLCESCARNTHSEGKMQNFFSFQQAAHILNTGRVVIKTVNVTLLRNLMFLWQWMKNGILLYAEKCIP